MERKIFRLPAVLSAFFLLFIAGGAFAAIPQYAYRILLDTDNNASTGGAVTVVQGSEMPHDEVGIECIVQATGDLGTSMVVEQTVSCWNGSSFEQVSTDDTSYPINTNASTMVEFGTSRSDIGNPTGTVRGLFHVSQASLEANDYTNSFAFSLAVEPIPTLSQWLLWLLAAILALFALRTVRNNQATAANWIVGSLLLIASAGVTWAATITLDGNFSDWSGIPAIVTDPSGDSSNEDPNEDILQGFITSDDNNIYFRVDTMPLLG